MTDHGVLIRNAVAAADVAAYNRYAVSGSTAMVVDIDNGNVFQLAKQNTTVATGYAEVWDVEVPKTGSLCNLWMACEENVNTTTDGTLKYRGLNDNPQKFYTAGSTVFSAFKPQVGDIITITAECLTSALSTNTHINAANGVFTLTPAATPTDFALSFKYLVTTYISIGTGAVNNQRTTAYKFVCVNNSYSALG